MTNGLIAIIALTALATAAWAQEDEAVKTVPTASGRMPAILKDKIPASQPSPVVDGKEIVTHHTFNSACMKKEMGYNILLPPKYEQETGKRYPVVYWCHGLNGHEYKDIGSAIFPYQAMAAGELPPMIIVYLNGIAQSWYCDSADGKVLSETMIMKELIPHIDQTYRTIAGRAGRAVSGMSMGGYGCLHLAFKYPEMFSSVVSYGAGVFDLDSDPENLAATIFATSQKFIAEHPFTLLEKNLSKISGKLAIRIVCGADDLMMAVPNANLHDLLDKNKVQHEYEVMPGLKHDIRGMYTKVGVKGLKFAADAADKAAKAPQTQSKPAP